MSENSYLVLKLVCSKEHQKNFSIKGECTMKKFKFTALLATLVVSGGVLAACSSDEETPAASSSEAASSEVVESSEDVVSTASVSDQADVLEAALSADGNWIIATTADVTFTNDVTVAGEFHNKDDASGDIYRKFALYAQDSDRVVTDEFTITVPKLVVESENFNIVHGTVQGDVEVKANGFVLNGATVEGNVTFETQEQLDSATLDQDGGSVTGEVTVAE